MKLYMILALCLGVLRAMPVANAADLDLDQPMSAVAKTISCDKVYRVTLPLQGVDHTLTVVFGFPSHQSLRATGVQDTAERAVELSKLHYAEKRSGRVLDSGAIHVSKDLFNQLLGAIGGSEVFSLPTEKAVRYDEYLLVGTLDGSMVKAERYAAGDVKSLERVYGETAASTYLANRLTAIVGKAGGKKWAAGPAGNQSNNSGNQ